MVLHRFLLSHSRTLGVVCALVMSAYGLSGSVPTHAAAAANTLVSSANATPGNQPGPAWAALSGAQRQALAPLAASWDSLSAGQQRKWLEVSRNYPGLSSADQTKMHGRMSEWVRLSARERAAARLNFAATSEIAKELSAEEKKAKWEAYQALSAEDRKKLATQGNRPPVGAAPATRPVAAQKLVSLPPKAKTDTGAVTASGRPSKPAVDPKLAPVLPLPAASGEAASTAAAPAERVER